MIRQECEANLNVNTRARCKVKNNKTFPFVLANHHRVVKMFHTTH